MVDAASGYCVKCKAARVMVSPKTVKSKNGRYMMKGTCTKCKTKMVKFVAAPDAKKKA